MIRFEEAQKTIMAHAVPPTARETATLDTCIGRVLAEPVTADRAIPPYDRVAVDGYACRRVDLPGPLTLVETVGAGALPQKRIESGTCIRVMTGGVVPAGADTIVMVEDSAETAPEKIEFTRIDKNANIARKGEDAEAGLPLVPAGTRLSEKQVATLAAVGAMNPVVWKRPRVAILSTGDEVVPPEAQPLSHQIRDANGPVLTALCRRAGAEVSFTALVPDRMEELTATIALALEKSDIVLISGGVSKGKYDFVPDAVTRCGCKILFDSVAIKPGKPTTFAVGDSRTLFCLPGNPVSVFVTFELFVRPFIDKLSGVTVAPIDIMLPIGGRYERRSIERDEWLPATLRGGRVSPLTYHGSGHFHALAAADCIIRIPAGIATVAGGEALRARLL